MTRADDVAEGGVPECDSCRYAAADLQEFRTDEGGVKTLCGLCASTMAGMWYEYPRHHDPDAMEVVKTICYVGNAIIEAIRKGRAS